MDFRAQEEARQAKRLPLSALESVKVRSVNEIKSVIATLSAATSSSPVALSTNLKTGEGEVKLSVNTKSRSQREMIVDGLADVRKKLGTQEVEGEGIEINGVVMKPSRLADQGKAFHYVDPIISRYTGGYREGYYICWDLNDGYKYKYDIFEHKLVREATDATASGSI